MMLLRPEIVSWLKEGKPQEFDRAKRRAELWWDAAKNQIGIRLRGMGADDIHIHSMVYFINERDSGISGGGSAPNGLQCAIDEWNRAAGYPVKGGPR